MKTLTIERRNGVSLARNNAGEVAGAGWSASILVLAEQIRKFGDDLCSAYLLENTRPEARRNQ